MDLDQPPPKINDLLLQWFHKSRPESKSKSAKEPKPSHLNTVNSSGLFQLVSPDKMSVQYVGSGHHDYDVGAVQADCPAPTGTVGYYFEITVRNAGEKGKIAIGFTPPNYNLRRQPGWDPNSCGYHGDDGNIYRGHGNGEPFGPKFTTGDTVGAGINYASQEFFFTKNGKVIGRIDKDIKGPLYPTIAVHSPNEEVTVNFGEKRFLFDIKAFKLEERLKQQKAVEKLSLPPNVTHGIVRSYLLHYGYQDTLNSFDEESENSFLHNITAQDSGANEQGQTYALDHRKVLCELIRNGDIDSAFHNLQNWYPQVVQDETSAICFFLHIQRFIEFIREDQLPEAVNYARGELNKFLKVKDYAGVLEDAIALFAYGNPQKSSVGYLLSQSQREFIADAVNFIVLWTNPDVSNPDKCRYTSLEKLLSQTTVCTLERRNLDDNQGEAFDLHREQLKWGWKSTTEDFI